VLNKKICLLVEYESISLLQERRHVFLLNKKTSLLAEQEDIAPLAFLEAKQSQSPCFEVPLERLKLTWDVFWMLLKMNIKCAKTKANAQTT